MQVSDNMRELSVSEVQMVSGGAVEPSGKINWMKAIINEADKVITISPYYAEELTRGGKELIFDTVQNVEDTLGNILST